MSDASGAANIAQSYLLVVGNVMASQKPEGSAFRYAIALAEGERYIIDTGGPDVLLEGWDDGADVVTFTNRATVESMAAGTFDIDNPGPEHIFMWNGDEAAVRLLHEAVMQVVLEDESGEVVKAG